MAVKQKSSKAADTRLASAHLQERREARYTVPFDIEVSGIDQDGEVFHERTITRNVSEWGCGFLLSLELKPEDILAIRLVFKSADKPPRPRQSLFQVVRVTREQNGWLVGAWKMDSENIWGVEPEKIARAERGNPELRRDESSIRTDKMVKNTKP